MLFCNFTGMDTPKSPLLSNLKIEDFTDKSKFLCIEEMNNADGSFILSSVIKDEIDQNRNIILILCHNSIGHFHSIGQKLGYNLMGLKDSKRVFLIDVMEKVVNEEFILSSDPLKNIYYDIKKYIMSCDEDKKGICIVVENISNLLLVQIENVFSFIQYLRGLVIEREHSKMVCSFHNFTNSWNENVIFEKLKHVANIVVSLNDLKTGRASDISGYMTIRVDNEKFLRSTSQYQYLLQDKTVKVFAPGTT